MNRNPRVKELYQEGQRKEDHEIARQYQKEVERYRTVYNQNCGGGRRIIRKSSDE